MKASKFLRPKQTRYLACFATHKHMQLNTEVPEFNLAEIFSINYFIFLDSFTEILINLPRFSYFAHLAGLLPFLMCVIFLREELFFSSACTIHSQRQCSYPPPWLFTVS